MEHGPDICNCSSRLSEIARQKNEAVTCFESLQQRVVSAYNAGETARLIAEREGITEALVDYYRVKAGARPKGEVRRERILDMVSKGMSRKEIAEQLGMRRDALDAWFGRERIKNPDVVSSYSQFAKDTNRTGSKSGCEVSASEKSDLQQRFDPATLGKLEEKQDELLAAYHAGMTMKQLAEKFPEWSPMTLSRYFRLKGLAGRNYGGQELTKEQESLIRGTLFGDGHMSLDTSSARAKNAHLTLSHGDKQREYLAHKIEMISNLFKRKGIGVTERGGGIQTLWAGSRSSPYLTSIYREYYIRPDEDCCSIHVHKKMFTPSNLAKISGDPRALAYWFMDDGSRTEFSLSIIVGGIPEEEAKLCFDWFASEGFIPTNLYKVPNAQAWTIRFNREVSRKLSEYMRPYFHPSMLYKLDGVEMVRNKTKLEVYGGVSPTSKYKGVTRYKHNTANPQWAAQAAMGNRTNKRLGYFLTEEEAGRAYDRFACFTYGADKSVLNFPEEHEPGRCTCKTIGPIRKPQNEVLRERILAMVNQGLTRDEIAWELGIARKSVDMWFRRQAKKAATNG